MPGRSSRRTGRRLYSHRWWQQGGKKLSTFSFRPEEQRFPSSGIRPRFSLSISHSPGHNLRFVSPVILLSLLRCFIHCISLLSFSVPFHFLPATLVRSFHSWKPRRLAHDVCCWAYIRDSLQYCDAIFAQSILSLSVLGQRGSLIHGGDPECPQ